MGPKSRMKLNDSRPEFDGHMECGSDSQSQFETPRRSRSRFVAVVLTVLGVATALVSWRIAPTPVPARRPVAGTSSPYQNTRLGVKYVGDAACVRCHAEIAETYRLHPMGRSLFPIAAAASPEPAEDRAGRSSV